MLKISELRQHKQTLETDIAKLIVDFENKTGVKVDGLIAVLHEHEKDVNDGQISVKTEIHVDI